MNGRMCNVVFTTEGQEEQYLGNGMHWKIYHAEYTLFDTGRLIHFVSLKLSYHMHS